MDRKIAAAALECSAALSIRFLTPSPYLGHRASHAAFSRPTPFLFQLDSFLGAFVVQSPSRFFPGYSAAPNFERTPLTALLLCSGSPTTGLGPNPPFNTKLSTLSGRLSVITSFSCFSHFPFPLPSRDQFTARRRRVATAYSQSRRPRYTQERTRQDKQAHRFLFDLFTKNAARTGGSLPQSARQTRSQASPALLTIEWLRTLR